MSCLTWRRDGIVRRTPQTGKQQQILTKIYCAMSRSFVIKHLAWNLVHKKNNKKMGSFIVKSWYKVHMSVLSAKHFVIMQINYAWNLLHSMRLVCSKAALLSGNCQTQTNLMLAYAGAELTGVLCIILCAVAFENFTP